MEWTMLAIRHSARDRITNPDTFINEFIKAATPPNAKEPLYDLEKDAYLRHTNDLPHLAEAYLDTYIREKNKLPAKSSFSGHDWNLRQTDDLPHVGDTYMLASFHIKVVEVNRDYAKAIAVVILDG